MTEKDRIANRCRNRQLFKLGSPMNVVRLNTGNTLRHEYAKFGLCWGIAVAGRAFLTEAEFRGGRADVVDLDEGIIYEVAVSEKEASLIKKASIYPLPVVPVFIPESDNSHAGDEGRTVSEPCDPEGEKTRSLKHV